MTEDTSPEIDKLIENLKDENVDVRSAAVAALEKIGDTRAVEQLIEVIDYGNHERHEHVTDVGYDMTGGPPTEEFLRMLYMFDWDVSIAAAEALGKIGDADAVEPLINMLETGASNRYEDRSGYPVTIALGRIGDSRAINPLVKELSDGCDELTEEGHGRSEEGGYIPEWYACQMVPEALIQIGDKKAIEPLIGLMLNAWDWWESTLAAEALSGLGWKPETDELKAAYLVSVKDWEGCRQLGKVGTEKAIEYLALLLYYRDPMSGFRYHHEIEEAFESFGEMAIEPLVKLLDKGDEVKAVTEALEKLGHEVE